MRRLLLAWTLQSIDQMSDLEDELLRQMREAGLPEPIREFKFAKEAMGRQWRMDFCWPDKLVAVEVEGGLYVNGRHNRGAGYESDMDKYNSATLLGYRILRVGAKLIKSGDAVNIIEQLLAKLEGPADGCTSHNQTVLGAGGKTDMDEARSM